MSGLVTATTLLDSYLQAQAGDRDAKSASEPRRIVPVATTSKARPSQPSAQKRPYSPSRDSITLESKLGKLRLQHARSQATPWPSARAVGSSARGKRLPPDVMSHSYRTTSSNASKPGSVAARDDSRTFVFASKDARGSAQSQPPPTHPDPVTPFLRLDADSPPTSRLPQSRGPATRSTPLPTTFHQQSAPRAGPGQRPDVQPPERDASAVGSDVEPNDDQDSFTLGDSGKARLRHRVGHGSTSLERTRSLLASQQPRASSPWNDTPSKAFLSELAELRRKYGYDNRVLVEASEQAPPWPSRTSPAGGVQPWLATASEKFVFHSQRLATAGAAPSERLDALWSAREQAGCTPQYKRLQGTAGARGAQNSASDAVSDSTDSDDTRHGSDVHSRGSTTSGIGLGALPSAPGRSALRSDPGVATAARRSGVDPECSSMSDSVAQEDDTSPHHAGPSVDRGCLATQLNDSAVHERIAALHEITNRVLRDIGLSASGGAQGAAAGGGCEPAGGRQGFRETVSSGRGAYNGRIWAGQRDPVHTRCATISDVATGKVPVSSRDEYRRQDDGESRQPVLSTTIRAPPSEVATPPVGPISTVGGLEDSHDAVQPGGTPLTDKVAQFLAGRGTDVGLSRADTLAEDDAATSAQGTLRENQLAAILASPNTATQSSSGVQAAVAKVLQLGYRGRAESNAIDSSSPWPAASSDEAWQAVSRHLVQAPSDSAAGAQHSVGAEYIRRQYPELFGGAHAAVDLRRVNSDDTARGVTPSAFHSGLSHAPPQHQRADDSPPHAERAGDLGVLGERAELHVALQHASIALDLHDEGERAPAMLGLSDRALALLMDRPPRKQSVLGVS